MSICDRQLFERTRCKFAGMYAKKTSLNSSELQVTLSMTQTTKPSLLLTSFCQQNTMDEFEIIVTGKLWGFFFANIGQILGLDELLS